MNFKKMPFSTRKMHFLDKNDNLTPSAVQCRQAVKELFFGWEFFYLNPEGFVGGRWRRW